MEVVGAGAVAEAACLISRYHRQISRMLVAIHNNNNNSPIINSKAITGDHLKAAWSKFVVKNRDQILTIN